MRKIGGDMNTRYPLRDGEEGLTNYQSVVLDKTTGFPESFSGWNWSTLSVMKGFMDSRIQGEKILLDNRYVSSWTYLDFGNYGLEYKKPYGASTYSWYASSYSLYVTEWSGEKQFFEKSRTNTSNCRIRYE